MNLLGSQLRLAREELGWTIEQASFHTRIQPMYLECLELDEYSLFASATYAKSFLRKYSQFLCLDFEQEIRSLEIVGYAPPTSNLISRETLTEKLETAENFAEDIKRYRNTEDVKGSPVFLVGSIVFLLVAMSSFYYLGSQANIPESGAKKIVIDFERIGNSFSRKRDVVETNVKEFKTLPMMKAAPVEMAPLANIRETSYSSESKSDKKPQSTSMDPSSDL